MDSISSFGVDDKLIALKNLVKYDVKRFDSFDALQNLSIGSVSGAEIASYFQDVAVGGIKSVLFQFLPDSEPSGTVPIKMTFGSDYQMSGFLEICGANGFTGKGFVYATTSTQNVSALPDTEFVLTGLYAIVKIVFHRVA